MELDHLFIATKPGAVEEGKLLQAVGLNEGTPNTHPGQGTANRRFFFNNTTLELLWIYDEAEAQSERTRPTGLWQRCSRRDNSISPFGLCFRPTHDESHAPFPYWPYHPVYLPAHLAVEVGDAPLTEPMWFYLPFARRQDSFSLAKGQPIIHETGFKELTGATVTIIDKKPFSMPAQSAMASGINLQNGNEHLLELRFDDGARGKQHDFRPLLPLVFYW